MENISEIKILLEQIEEESKKPGVQAIFNNSTKKLVALYNSNIDFNKGKQEDFFCRPCVDKVKFFFSGFLLGYQQSENDLMYFERGIRS